MPVRECIVCNSKDHGAHHCSVDGSDYIKCAQCGLIYVDKLDSTEKIYTAYSGGWLKSFRRKLVAPIRKLHHVQSYESSMERAGRIVEFATAQTDIKQGSYLDIGCNKGFLLSVAITKGWDVYGAEIVPELTVPFGNTYKKYKDHVFAGRFCDVRPYFTSGQFDLITAIDVIEHFEDPDTDFKGIYEVLKPGGVFVIQTPEAACDMVNELMDKWGALKPLEHLHLFTAENLKDYAAKFGFTEYKSFEPFEQADGNFVAVMRKPK